MICIGEALPDGGATEAEVAIVGAGAIEIAWPSVSLVASVALP